MLTNFLKGIIVAAAILLCSNPSYTQEVPVNNTEVNCLAMNIHYEARGEAMKGKIAVGHVTLNRVKSKFFPESICGVVKQKKQFSWVKPNTNFHAPNIPDETFKLAVDILNGKYKDYSRGALYFHNENVPPFPRKETTRIGRHIFYS